MPFTTSHTESGEGPRGVKAALERTLDWLKEAQPGNAVVRWRITMSFKESDAEAPENESARRSLALPFDVQVVQPQKRGRKKAEALGTRRGSE